MGLKMPTFEGQTTAALLASTMAAGVSLPGDGFAAGQATTWSMAPKPRILTDYEKAAAAGTPYTMLSTAKGAARPQAPEPNTSGSYLVYDNPGMFPVPGKEPGFVISADQNVSLEVVGPVKFTIVFFPLEHKAPAQRSHVLTLKYTIDGVQYAQTYSMRGDEEILYAQGKAKEKVVMLAGINFPITLPAGAHTLTVQQGSHAGVFHIQGLQRGAAFTNGTRFAPDRQFEEDPDRPGEFTVGMYIQDNPSGAATRYTPRETSEPSVPVPDLKDMEVEEIRGRPGTVRVTRTSTRGECTGKPYTYEGIARVGKEVPVHFIRVWPPVKSDPGAKGPAEYPVDVAWGFDDNAVARLRAGALDAAGTAESAREAARSAWAVINGTGGIKQQLDSADPKDTTRTAALNAQLRAKTAEAVRLETAAVAAEVAAREAWSKVASAEEQRFMVSPVLPDGPQPPADVTRAVCVIPGTVAAVRANVFQVGAAADKPRAVYAASLDVGAETRTPADCLAAIRAQMQAATFNPANKLPNACLDGFASQLQRWRVTMKNRR